jgi:TrmH family RNA methyltransferase
MGLSQNRSKLIQRLRNPRFRPREGLFLVEGLRVARELLNATHELRMRFALVSPRLESTEEGRFFLDALAGAGCPVERVSDSELDQVSDTQGSQGLIMVVEEPHNSLSDLGSGKETRVLLLDGIQDPGNAGTLMRAAWALGASGLVALEGTVDPWNPKVVRSSAGSFAHLPVVSAPWETVAEWLSAVPLPLLVADPGGKDVRGYSPPASWALAVGNEGRGPRAALLARAHKTLAITMVPGADSLNAGVAGAILLFALARFSETDMEA